MRGGGVRGAGTVLHGNHCTAPARSRAHADSCGGWGAGYVLQDDVLPGTSTVAEYLMFHARLRLPSRHSQEALRRRVATIIAELSLNKVNPDSWHVCHPASQRLACPSSSQPAIGMSVIQAAGHWHVQPAVGMSAIQPAS
jgi:hypothetical protein